MIPLEGAKSAQHDLNNTCICDIFSVLHPKYPKITKYDAVFSSASGPPGSLNV